jgi:hypothetical protein
MRAVAILALILCVPVYGSAAMGTTVEPGVYECNGSHGIQTGPTVGVIDARRYRDFDGGTGTFRYDATSNLLEIASGPLNRGKSLGGRW